MQNKSMLVKALMLLIGDNFIEQSPYSGLPKQQFFELNELSYYNANESLHQAIYYLVSSGIQRTRENNFGYVYTFLYQAYELYNELCEKEEEVHNTLMEADEIPFMLPYRKKYQYFEDFVNEVLNHEKFVLLRHCHKNSFGDYMLDNEDVIILGCREVILNVIRYLHLQENINNPLEEVVKMLSHYTNEEILNRKYNIV